MASLPNTTLNPNPVYLRLTIEMNLRSSRRRAREKRLISSSFEANARDSQVIDAEMAKGRFSFVYSGSKQKEVKVKHCVPLFISRTICKSAVNSLCRLFDVDEHGTIGFSYAGGLKVVVKIPEEELHLVKRYFIQQGQSQHEAEDFAFAQGIQWYGIVDGIHTHQSLSDLERSRPDPFQDFKWTVSVIEWQSIKVLKAFSRARNMLQTTNAVEMTLFDAISGILDIALQKANLAGESMDTFAKRHGIIKEVADDFSGGTKYSRQTTRTLTGAALRIKREAMVVLGQIMTEENKVLAGKIMEKTSLSTVLPEDVFDARAYKNIISTNTIRGATAFLRADGTDQSNALLRLKFSYESNGFKTFQAARLNKEIERCQRARHQDQLMKIMMSRYEWPVELADVKKKLFQTSLFDSELDECSENTNIVLESLVSEYQEKMPLEAGLRWQLYLDRIGTRGPSQAQGNHGSSSPSADDTNGNSPSVINDFVSVAGDDIPNDDTEIATDSCPLQRLNLNCLKLTLEKYLTKRGSEDEKFHLVLGDPSQLQLNGTCKVNIDEKKADKYVAILKSLVLEHGWVFLYTSAVEFAKWSKAFKAHEFEVLPYPWIMVRNTDTIQANTSPIPQNVTELLIGARRSGTGQPENQPDITSSYRRSVSSRRRKFAVMDNCPEPRLKIRKLDSREPLRTNQRSAETIAEFMETFCPASGYVLDAFAGTMETAKACYMTGRKCVALEADEDCYHIAVDKLKESASAYLEQTARHSTDILTNSVRGCEIPETSSPYRENGVFRETSIEQSPFTQTVAVEELNEQEGANMSVPKRSMVGLGENRVRRVSPLTSDSDNSSIDK